MFELLQNIKGPAGTFTELTDPLLVPNAMQVGEKFRISKLTNGGQVEVKNSLGNWIQQVEWLAPFEPLAGEVLPSAVPNVVIWLKADALSLNDDDIITTWSDSYGGAYTASVTALITGCGAGGPTFKTNIVNGKPVARFNGSNQGLEISYLVPHIDTPNNVFAVARQTSKATKGILVNGWGDDQLVHYLASGTGYPHAGVGGTEIVESVDRSGAFHNFCFMCRGGSQSKLYVDGHEVARGAGGTNQLSSDTVGIIPTGPPEVLTGDIAEIIMVGTGEISEYHRQGLEIYFCNKYQLPYPPSREILPVTDGLALWMKAQSIDWPDATNVGYWYDSSAGLRFDTCGYAVSQPVLRTNIVNGKPIIRFNGDNYQGIVRSALGITQPDTVFIVAKPIGAGGRLTDSDMATRQLTAADNTGFAMNAGSATIKDNIDHTGAFHVFTAEFNGASSKGYVDGTQTLTGNPGTGGIDRMFIGWDGSTATLTADIAEIIIYNHVLSDSDRQTVTQYPKTKYGIT